MKTWAKVRTQFDAVHQWFDAKGAVKFLKHPHHHRFMVTVWVQQSQKIDRDIEYLTLKMLLDEYLIEMQWSESDFSCEYMAKTILEFLKELYPKRQAKVEVTEDGFDGALLESEEGD